MPTVDDIVAELREAKRQRLVGLVSLANLAVALNKDRSNVRKTAKKLGIKYAFIDNDGTSYLTQDDATLVAEKLV